jgi:hypothetical protein
MNFKYKVLDYKPEQEYILFELTCPEDPDFIVRKSFNPPTFDQTKIIEMVTMFSSSVAGRYIRAQEHPKELPIPEEGGFFVEPEMYAHDPTPPTMLPQPDYDPFTHRIEREDYRGLEQKEIGWLIIELTAEEQARVLQQAEISRRMDRNQLLLESDFFNFPDACIANVQDWLDYRQELRDLPEQPGWPKKIVWPTRPQVVKESH